MNNEAVRFIPLTQGKIAVVDAADYDSVAAYDWYAQERNGRWYAMLKGRIRGSKQYRMHQVIMGFPDSEVDHKDGNGLNNTRQNLRLASTGQNQHNARRRKDNSSGFKGVRAHFSNKKRSGKWVASIVHNGKTISAGVFDSPLEAARAYDAKAEELFGEFARLNFPKERKIGRDLAPERIYLPADTNLDVWNILAKNPSHDWGTGEPADTIEYRRVDPPTAPTPLIEKVRSVRNSSLWNANSYDAALTDLINDLESEAYFAPVNGLRALLDRYTTPCDQDCNHSQCPLLRDLYALHAKAVLERARLIVQPIVDREKKGEEIGNLMNMRLRAPAAPDERDKALAQMDWQQVVFNGGPPCFAQLDDERGWYCGRAQRWEGHDGEHKFVSLEDLLATVRAEGELPPHKAINFLTALEHQVHRNHEYYPTECGECAMTEQIANKLREQLGLESARTGKVG